MVHDEARLGHLDPIGFSLFDFFRYKIVYFEHMPRARCVDLEVGDSLKWALELEIS